MCDTFASLQVGCLKNSERGDRGDRYQSVKTAEGRLRREKVIQAMGVSTLVLLIISVAPVRSLHPVELPKWVSRYCF